MTVTPATVETVNRERQQIPVTPVRTAELPVELNQLAAAIARVRDRLDFDQDPSDFIRAHRNGR